MSEYVPAFNCEAVSVHVPIPPLSVAVHRTVLPCSIATDPVGVVPGAVTATWNAAACSAPTVTGVVNDSVVVDLAATTVRLTAEEVDPVTSSVAEV